MRLPFFASNFAENVPKRSCSIALQQIEVETSIWTAVCGMDDAKVTHFNMGIYGEHCKNRVFCFLAKNCAINLNRKTEYKIIVLNLKFRLKRRNNRKIFHLQFYHAKNNRIFCFRWRWFCHLGKYFWRRLWIPPTNIGSPSPEKYSADAHVNTYNIWSGLKWA